MNNCGGVLRYGKHETESFFQILFFCVTLMQLLFTRKYLLSFTGNALLIFYFESLFCFKTMLKNFFFISSFFSCYNISALVTYLTKNTFTLSTKCLHSLHCLNCLHCLPLSTMSPAANSFM